MEECNNEIKDILYWKRKKATESSVTFSVASSTDDISSVLLLSKHPLPVSHGLKFASLKSERRKETIR